uniref:Uncharacterized protein n=1 Tax=Romanomermis culicivorax TaxID=13658 RepID=A0A915HUF2_ROMCU
MKKDPEEYKLFYSKYALFFKEGILRSTDQSEKEDIAKLLMFESSDRKAGVDVTLQDYCSRMQAGQRDIYYLCAPSRELAENSPYFEVLKKRNVEVLFCYAPYDEVTMLQLMQFDRKNITCAEKGAAAAQDPTTDPKSQNEEMENSSAVSSDFFHILLIYDNAMITAGLVDSARPMVGRLTSLIAKLLDRKVLTINDQPKS